MKKLIFLISIIAALFIQGAQSQESATYDVKMGYPDSWLTYTMPTGTNATTATDSTWYYTFWVLNKTPVKYDFKVRLTKVSGTTRSVPVVLKAKKFLSDSWSTITTTTWYTGVDTTILFNQTTTIQYYKYWQINTIGARAGYIFRIPEISLNTWEQ
jgi:hypothetical protein